MLDTPQGQERGPAPQPPIIRSKSCPHEGASPHHPSMPELHRSSSDSQTINSPRLSSTAPSIYKSPKVIFHFVRHGQAKHNVKKVPYHERVAIHDPSLTWHGFDQCTLTRIAFPYMSKIKYVFTSPLLRTIQTTLHAFKPVLDRGVSAIAWGDLREHGSGASSEGVPLHILKKRTIKSGMPLNLDLLDEDWHINWHDSDHDRWARADRVRSDLLALSKVVLNGGTWKQINFVPHTGTENVEIVIVSHGAFLSRLLGYSDQVFHNLQWRSYKFVSRNKMDHDGAGPLDLHETEESRRHKHVRLPDPDTIDLNGEKSEDFEFFSRCGLFHSYKMAPNTIVDAKDFSALNLPEGCTDILPILSTTPSSTAIPRVDGPNDEHLINFQPSSPRISPSQMNCLTRSHITQGASNTVQEDECKLHEVKPRLFPLMPPTPPLSLPGTPKPENGSQAQSPRESKPFRGEMLSIPKLRLESGLMLKDDDHSSTFRKPPTLRSHSSPTPPPLSLRTTSRSSSGYFTLRTPNITYLDPDPTHHFPRQQPTNEDEKTLNKPSTLDIYEFPKWNPAWYETFKSPQEEESATMMVENAMEDYRNSSPVKRALRRLNSIVRPKMKVLEGGWGGEFVI